MSETKILSVEPTDMPDQLLVKGKVGKQDVQVNVWHSHLYGDQPDPDATHGVRGGSAAYHRAPEGEINPGPRDPQVPQTDAQRRKYLIGELEAAAKPTQDDAKLQKLADS